mmetsp:Transcript_22772/g.51022  ORF Transcript_22772/g.51022 Transcript_22772/m.51022 type:complete len:224 (-) Transcript_22772:967-1638(-)
MLATLDADILRPLEGIRVDPLDHGLDLLKGADLEEIPDALHDHRLHRRLPEDFVSELHLHVFDESGRISACGHLLACDVEVDRTFWRRHLVLQVFERLGQLILSRLHQFRVEGAARLDSSGLQGLGRHGPLAKLVDGRLRTCTSEARWEEEVGHLALWVHRCVGRLRFLAELVDLGPVQARHGTHCLRHQLRSLLHGLATDLHEPQAILEGQDPGRHDGSVLS